MPGKSERRHSSGPRKSVDPLLGFVERAPVAMALFDLSSRYVAASPLWIEQWQLGHDFVGRAHEELLPPMPDCCREGGRRAIEGETVICDGERCERADGVVRWLRCTLAPWSGLDGNILGFVVATEDLTRHKQIEERLRQSETRFRLAIAASRTVVYDTDLAVPGKSSLTGLSALLGIPDEAGPRGQAAWLDRIHPDDRLNVEAAHKRQRMDRERLSIDYRLRHCDGNYIWVHEEGEFAGDGTSAGRLVGTITDITERVGYEQALRDSERRFRGTFENAAVGMGHVSIDGRWIAVNDKLCEITGYSRAELLEKCWQELTDPDDIEADLAKERQMIAGEIATYQVEKRYRRKDGSNVWVAINVSLVRKADGEPDYLISVARDITGSKRAAEIRRGDQVRHAFLLQLTDRLRNANDPAVIQSEAARMLGRLLKLNRAGYAEIRGNGTALIAHAFVHDVSPIAGAFPFGEFVGALLGELMAGQTVVNADVANDGDMSNQEKRACAQISCAAFIMVPLIRSGQLIAAFFVHQSEARAWSDLEIDLVRETAERTWAAVARARAEEALVASHDTFRQLVESSPFGVYTVNADFRLTQVSAGARRVFENVEPLLGRDFAEVLEQIWPQPFAREATARFRHTLETGEPYRAPATVERRLDLDATEAYDWRIERVRLPDGRFGVVCHFYDLSERQRHEEHVRRLLREVNHRSKNLLAIVQAIARSTSEQSGVGFLPRFIDRLQSLSVSQDLLVRNDWKGVFLEDLVREQLGTGGQSLDRRITISGVPIWVSPAAAQNLGMALHELAANASRHGALGQPGGRIHVTWSVMRESSGGQFSMSWIEENPMLVQPPERTGFGSRMIGRLTETGLSAKVTTEYPPHGFRWLLSAPLAELLVDRD